MSTTELRSGLDVFGVPVPTLLASEESLDDAPCESWHQGTQHGTIPTMDSRVLPLAEVDPSFVQRWRALANRPDTVPNPFVDVDFLRPAAACLPEAKGLRLFVGEEHGDLVCVMPLIPSSQLGALRMVPGLRNYFTQSWLGQPLIAAGRESAAASSLLRYLSESPRIFWLRLQFLLADNGFAQSLLADGHASMEVESRGLAVRRPEPTYLSGHSNLKRLRRQRRAFEKSFGQPLDLVDSSADPNAVEEFLAIEAAGWKGREGGAFATKPGHAEFLRQMCGNFRDSGRLQLWSLRAGDQTLAIKLNLAVNDTMFCYAITFAEGHATLSPGLQLEVENFRLFHDQPRFRLMDSCAEHDNSFVNRLYPDRRSIVNLVVGSGPIGRTIVSLAPAGRRLIERRKAPAARPYRAARS